MKNMFFKNRKDNCLESFIRIEKNAHIHSDVQFINFKMEFWSWKNFI